MSDQEEPPVGSEPPLKPKRSLPSYREPTPETHRKFSRETEAELALKNTLLAPGTATLLVLFFLITIAAVPIIQFGAEFRAVHSFRDLPTFAAFGALIPRADSHPMRSIVDLWWIFPKADEIKSVQKTLENDSVIAQWLLPRVESVLTGKLRAGNEQVYLGHGASLFYRADVDYVIGAPFLDPFWIKRRRYSAGVQPDAARAIVDFRNQLARRGIDLVVLPTPVKPAIDGEMLAKSGNGPRLLENESFAQFKALLANQGVRVFDPEPLLMQRKAATRSPLYLGTDTHWRPETMNFVAQQVAAALNLAAPARHLTLQVMEKKLTALGDLARMLKLPQTQTSFHNEEVTIRQVAVGNGVWRPSKNADVLLLGDSFANIFSLETLGWGDSAGFAEQLSLALGGRPIDCILRNSDGAFATREILNRELARGRDRLAGKNLVIWQFVTRELAFGNWKLLDMTLRPSAPARFFTPQPGEDIVVTGTVEAISTVPRPGSAPYADHIMTVHLVDVSGPSQRNNQPLQCLVYLWSMRNYARTPAARLRPGDRIRLRLRPWSDVSAEYEKINRSEIDDAALQLEEPVWGEFAN